MRIPEVPDQEAARLEALRRYSILDTPAEQAYDDITALAAHICGVPIALISFVDAERQWFKSAIGFPCSETKRDVSFCAHAILGTQTMVIEDALEDERFVNNPLVTCVSGVRFYAGVPLITPDGQAIGTLCVLDYQPKVLSKSQQTMLEALARQVVTQLELMSANQKLLQSALELKQRNRDLDQFVHAVSHDLRAPLRGIDHLSEWIEEDLGAEIPAESKAQMALLRQRVKRMENLITGLLTFARAVQPNALIERVNLDQLLAEVMDSLSLSTKPNIHIDHNLSPFFARRLLLQQVLANLISNAIKHSSHRDSAVRVSAHRTASGYQFSVADNGPGILPKHHERIFRLFETLHPEQSDSIGIGLAIVKRIIDREGGKIWVESQVPCGTVFRFIWPAYPNPAGA